MVKSTKNRFISEIELCTFHFDAKTHFIILLIEKTEVRMLSSIALSQKPQMILRIPGLKTIPLLRSLLTAVGSYPSPLS